MAHTDERHNGKVLRHLHSPDGTKTFGFATFNLHEDGRVSNVENFEDRSMAMIFGCNVIPPDARKIDMVSGWNIYKLGDVYFCMNIDNPRDMMPKVYQTLIQAREACGWVNIALGIEPKTLPKSAYPQNQKGYDPASNKGK